METREFKPGDWEGYNGCESADDGRLPVIASTDDIKLPDPPWEKNLPCWNVIADRNGVFVDLIFEDPQKSAMLFFECTYDMALVIVAGLKPEHINIENL